MDKAALQKAVKAARGQTALADKIGKKQQTISDWLNRADRAVPLEDAIRIELATQRAVTALQIRPDLRNLIKQWAV